MKVAAYVHAGRIGDPTTGVGKHMINMVKGLAATGASVNVMLPRRDLDSSGQIVGSILRGLPTAPLPLSRWMLERLWTFGHLPKVDRYADNPDWVYCPAEVYIPSKAPLATTIHCVNWFDPELPWYDSPQTRKARGPMGYRFRQILKKSDRVLTVSEFLKRRIVELFGGSGDKITVVGNGVEDQYFEIANEPREKIIAGDAKPYILIVGGLTTRKGATYTFPVIEALARLRPDVEIKIAGFSEPEHLARAEGYSNIAQAGFLGLDQLPRLMRGAVALLFLSRYESFGIPAVEAMAAGTLAVVSRFAAQPEIVGDAGLAMDVNRPDEIADTLIALERDAGLREKYAALESVRRAISVVRLRRSSEGGS